MLCVTHEMGFARAVADRIVFIDSGKVCELTSPDEFFTHPQTERAQQFLNIFQYETNPVLIINTESRKINFFILLIE